MEYFNFKSLRESEFERFAIYFNCFSDNCCQETAGGNETSKMKAIPAHLNEQHI